METVPKEIVNVILDFLPGEDQFFARRVCKLWHKLLADIKKIWHKWDPVLQHWQLYNAVMDINVNNLLIKMSDKYYAITKHQTIWHMIIIGNILHIDLLECEDVSYMKLYLKHPQNNAPFIIYTDPQNAISYDGMTVISLLKKSRDLSYNSVNFHNDILPSNESELEYKILNPLDFSILLTAIN